MAVVLIIQQNSPCVATITCPGCQQIKLDLELQKCRATASQPARRRPSAVMAIVDGAEEIDEAAELKRRLARLQGQDVSESAEMNQRLARLQERRLSRTSAAMESVSIPAATVETAPPLGAGLSPDCETMPDRPAASPAAASRGQSEARHRQSEPTQGPQDGASRGQSEAHPQTVSPAFVEVAPAPVAACQTKPDSPAASPAAAAASWGQSEASWGQSEDSWGHWEASRGPDGASWKSFGDQSEASWRQSEASWSQSEASRAPQTAVPLAAFSETATDAGAACQAPTSPAASLEASHALAEASQAAAPSAAVHSLSVLPAAPVPAAGWQSASSTLPAASLSASVAAVTASMPGAAWHAAPAPAPWQSAVTLSQAEAARQHILVPESATVPIGQATEQPGDELRRWARSLRGIPGDLSIALEELLLFSFGDLANIVNRYCPSPGYPPAVGPFFQALYMLEKGGDERKVATVSEDPRVNAALTEGLVQLSYQSKLQPAAFSTPLQVTAPPSHLQAHPHLSPQHPATAPVAWPPAQPAVSASQPQWVQPWALPGPQWAQPGPQSQAPVQLLHHAPTLQPQVQPLQPPAMTQVPQHQLAGPGWSGSTLPWPAPVQEQVRMQLPQSQATQPQAMQGPPPVQLHVVQAQQPPQQPPQLLALPLQAQGPF